MTWPAGFLDLAWRVLLYAALGGTAVGVLYAAFVTVLEEFGVDLRSILHRGHRKRP